jgi:two-component system sensor histidine kinase NblS
MHIIKSEKQYFLRVFLNLQINIMNLYHQKSLTNDGLLLGLIHEFKSPLFNVKSFIETLYEYHFQLTDKQTLEFLEIVNKEINRLIRLINNNLNKFKLTSKSSSSLNYVSFYQIIKSVVKTYMLTSLNKRIPLYCILKLTPFNFKVDYDILFQVLTNLLSNALKFTYPGGLIVLKGKQLNIINIKSRTKNTFARVSVVDSGIGISKLISASLFSENKLLDIGSKFLDGTGLGISIIAEILATKGSYIRLVGKLNKGTTALFNCIT